MLTDDDVMQAYMDSGLNTDWMLFEMVQFARAVTAANNVKVLADMKPLMLAAGEDSCGRACMVKPLTNVCSAEQVSALIQRNAELEAKLAYYAVDKACQVSH